MWKLGTTIISILILFFTVANYFQMHVPSINASQIAFSSTMSSNDAYANFLAMQANQFSLLQVYLGAFGIVLTALGMVLAIAAIFGYAELKTSALKVAEEKINRDLPVLVKNEFLSLAPEIQAQIVAKATLEQKSSINLVQDVFQEGVEIMYQDPMNIPSIEDKYL